LYGKLHDSKSINEKLHARLTKYRSRFAIMYCISIEKSFSTISLFKVGSIIDQRISKIFYSIGLIYRVLGTIHTCVINVKSPSAHCMASITIISFVFKNL
jgi:hypothetical protein